MKTPLEKQLEKAYQIFSKDHARLRQQLLSSICEQQTEHEQIVLPRVTGLSFGGKIMTSRALKIAAGIIIVAIIAAGIRFFAGSKASRSVAFGQVLRHIQNSSYTFDLTTVAEGQSSPVVKGKVLRPGKLRIDAPQVMGGVSSIADVSAKKYLLLFHGQKTAMTEIPGSEKVPDGAGPFALFLSPVENLWNLRDGTEKSLGQKEIEGQSAVGFQVQQEDQDYECDIVVWARAETGSPIRVEMTTYNPEDRSQSMTIVMSNFNLDVQLDEELFSLEPPPGYTLAHQKALEETVTDTESTLEAQKIERSLALWSNGQEDESVQTLLSVNWTKPIEFYDKMYLFSLTEKGYVGLRPQDQQQVMKEIMETLKQLRGPVKKLWELAETARANRDYQEAESCLETTLNLGRLVNRNSEGVLLSRSFGLSIQRKSLDEMKVLYEQMNQQDKVQQIEEEIRKVDAERESFLKGLKTKFGK